MSVPLILAVVAGLVGLAGFVLSWVRWRRVGKAARTALLLAGGTTLLGVVSSAQTMIWDGGYPQAEFRLTFVDSDGKPVEGIQLRVEDRDRHVFYHYPVTDYLPDRTPTSDRAGRMVFHHVSNAVEFSGTIRFVYFLFPVVVERGPAFVCRFRHRGEEVYCVGFGELDSWEGTWETGPKVKWRWPPDWPPQLLPGEDDLYERAIRFYKIDGKRRPEPEEVAAFHAATSRRAEEAALARRRGEDKEDELEFPIVTKTVIIRPHSPGCP